MQKKKERNRRVRLDSGSDNDCTGSLPPLRRMFHFEGLPTQADLDTVPAFWRPLTLQQRGTFKRYPDHAMLDRNLVAKMLSTSVDELDGWAVEQKGPPITDRDGEERYQFSALRQWAADNGYDVGDSTGSNK